MLLVFLRIQECLIPLVDNRFEARHFDVTYPLHINWRQETLLDCTEVLRIFLIKVNFATSIFCVMVKHIKRVLVTFDVRLLLLWLGGLLLLLLLLVSCLFDLLHFLNHLVNNLLCDLLFPSELERYVLVKVHDDYELVNILRVANVGSHLGLSRNESYSFVLVCADWSDLVV